MLSVRSEPIFEKKTPKQFARKMPKNAQNPFKDKIEITRKFLL